MKLARIITIAMTVIFSTGVALAPWTPVNAEDAKTTKDKDKDKPKKTHKKVAKTEKSDKAATPAGQPKSSEGGGKY